MCLLTYFPPNVHPNADALYNGTLTNDDGQGFAIVSRDSFKRDRLIIRHGMNAEDMVNQFVKLRRKFPTGPALFHSRFGTGGSYSRYNCHPFRFRGDRRTVVAHNGVLPKSVQPGKKDNRCDTRIAAEELFPSGFGNLSIQENRDKLGLWIGKWNKLVILTVNPAYDQQAYIINEDSGIWDRSGEGDIWYSNSDYLTSTRTILSTMSSMIPQHCPYCGEFGTIDPECFYCTECELCVDCGQRWSDMCQCYNPLDSDDAVYSSALERFDYTKWWERHDQYVEAP